MEVFQKSVKDILLDFDDTKNVPDFNTKNLADLCRRGSTPLDVLLDSFTLNTFDSKPNFIEVLKSVSISFCSEKEPGKFFFTYENIINISNSNTLKNELSKGSGFMFLLCVMQKLNLNVLTFVDGIVEDYYTPRWFALLEIVTVHYVMGNQEPLKRRRNDGMSLAEMISDREKAWRRFKDTFFCFIHTLSYHLHTYLLTFIYFTYIYFTVHTFFCRVHTNFVTFYILPTFLE